MFIPTLTLPDIITDRSSTWRRWTVGWRLHMLSESESDLDFPFSKLHVETAWWTGINYLKGWTPLGSAVIKDGIVVKALTSHQCGLSFFLVLVSCGMTLLLVLSLAPKGFLQVLWFSSPLSNQHIQIQIWHWHILNEFLRAFRCSIGSIYNNKFYFIIIKTPYLWGPGAEFYLESLISVLLLINLCQIQSPIYSYS